jgi:transcriptional regulator with XRE-family HTH domain
VRALAALSGLDASTISRIETGKLGASQETISRIALALRVSEDDITRGDDDMPPTDKAEKDEAKTVEAREVPFPGTPEGQVFHYTPEEAERFLPWTALALRRKAYRREIPFNKAAGRISFTGRDIQEISDMTAVRPLAETRKKAPAA